MSHNIGSSGGNYDKKRVAIFKLSQRALLPFYKNPQRMANLNTPHLFQSEDDLSQSYCQAPKTILTSLGAKNCLCQNYPLAYIIKRAANAV